MIDLRQMRVWVVRPALATLSSTRPTMLSLAAENLILGTIYQESVVGSVQYLRQANSGPALGIGMVEPATLHDIVDRWLRLPDQADILGSFRRLLTPEPLEQQIVSNLSVTVAVMRLKYFISPMPLPAATDASGLAAYYKAVYNTAGGAARIGADLTRRFTAAISS